MLTDTQKQAREGSLGSSDAPIVAGVSPYKSPLELYFQLHGDLPRYTDEETQAQRIGSKLEPMIAELAAEDLGLKIRRSATRRHSIHTFMVANLDFEIVNNPKGPGILECKNRGASHPFDTLPDDIQLQVAQQMAVTNREWGIVAVLFGFGTLKTYEVTRDKELEDYLIELEMRFMQRVEKGEPPDHTWTPETVEILKKLYPADSGTAITLTTMRAAETFREFQHAKQLLAEAESLKAAAEGFLKEAMKDASTCELPGVGTITWKSTKAGQRFDVDAFKQERPEMYQAYLKIVPGYRRFLAKPAKELST
jgi:predicted phage-related endonuclease